MDFGVNRQTLAPVSLRTAERDEAQALEEGSAVREGSPSTSTPKPVTGRIGWPDSPPAGPGAIAEGRMTKPSAWSSIRDIVTVGI